MLTSIAGMREFCRGDVGTGVPSGHVTANALRDAGNGAGPPQPAPGRPASAIFDISIDLAQPAELLHTISGWASEGRTRRVMYVNAHVVNQSRLIPCLGEALRRADLVYCDGYGVRLAARVLNMPVPHRMTGADWDLGPGHVVRTDRSADLPARLKPPIAREAAARLRRWYPRLQVVGAHHGFFDSDSPRQRAGNRGHQRPPAADRARRDGDTEAGAVGRPLR